MSTENKLSVQTLSMPESTYTVPESSRQTENDPKTITIRAWTTGQELDAIRASTGGDLQHELLQRAVIEIDGTGIDQASDFMEKWGPKVRQLALVAMNDVGLPSEEDRKDFLASVVRKVR